MNARGVEWALLVLGGSIALYLASRRKDLDRLDVVLASLIPMAGGVVLVHLFERIAQGPMDAWNAGRLSTSIGLVRGFDIYPTLHEGPILDFMYGPMAALFYTPAALADSPSSAIWIGITLSFLFAVAPFAWFAARKSEPRKRHLSAAAVVCFGLFCTYDAGLRMAAWSIHADAPAMGFSGLACVCLLVGSDRPSSRRLFLTALFAVLAVWSKQPAVLIVASLPLYLWIRDGRQQAIRCALWIGGVGVVVSLVFVLWFGFEDLFLSMFRIPFGHPWKQSSSKFVALLESCLRISWASRFAIALILGAAATSYPRGKSLRAWLHEHPWTGFAWVGIFMIPTAVLGNVKIGGSVSPFAMATWFLAAAGIAGLAQVAATSQRVRAQLAGVVLAGIMAFAIGYELGAPSRREALENAAFQLRHRSDNPLEQAVAFARAHPGEVLFVSNPLIGLYSDDALYHSFKGILDRMVSGLTPPSPELLRAHNPPRLRYLATRGTRRPNRFQRPDFFYPDFDTHIRPERMDHHSVWVRAGDSGKHRPGITSPRS
ncbi:MAG: hypothetical protein JRG90_00005 [Deltaproteobacteria bacterium]|nr:hypothetical protein [Deltaproteobacteria bacterium]